MEESDKNDISTLINSINSSEVFFKYLCKIIGSLEEYEYHHNKHDVNKLKKLLRDDGVLLEYSPENSHHDETYYMPTIEAIKEHFLSDEEKITTKLIDNFFNFMNRAIRFIDNDLELSVICLSAAAEFFLKARISHEHWYLIVGNKGKLSGKDSFLKGDFFSIGFKECMSLIKSLNIKSLSKKEECIFNEVSECRNKIVHFCNSPAGSGLDRISCQICSGNTSSEIIQNAISEQKIVFQ